MPLAPAPCSCSPSSSLTMSSSSMLQARARLPSILRRGPSTVAVRSMAAGGGGGADAGKSARAAPLPTPQQRAPSAAKSPSDGAAGAADRARRRTGYKNNWQRRGADELAPQVVMRAPFPSGGGGGGGADDNDQPIARVAIVGGGVSGLVCARELAALGIRSVVFDTGERGPGGRLATRTTADGSFKKAGTGLHLAFDHAAQFVTADAKSEFAALAREWQSRGWLREWPAGRVVGIGGAAVPPSPHYVPATAGGFRALARALADDAEATGFVEMRCGAWVSRVTAEAAAGKWRVAVRKASSSSGGGKASCADNDAAAAADNKPTDALLFDAVVIAHNGKCANRLATPCGSPLVAQQLMRLRLSAAWVAMLAFERPIGLPFEGAFVGGASIGRGATNEGGKQQQQQQQQQQASSPLAWAANNTAKLGLAPLPPSDGTPAVAPECWTLVSTDAYAQRRKVPQERVPAEVARAVADELTAAFAEAAAGKDGVADLPPLVAPPRVQLWGAALPLNSPGVPAILDPAARVGVCGDWLLGAGVQAAAESGLALARRLAALRGVPMERCVAALEENGGEDGLAAGLRAPFAPLGARTGPCGEFPGGEGAVQQGVSASRRAPPTMLATTRR